MNDPIDIQGVWWLPASPDHKVPGWLRYDSENGGELRLSGSIRPREPLKNGRDGVVTDPPQDQRIYPRIHGQSGRKFFNLEDSFQISIEHYLCRDDDSAEKIHVNWLLTGAWFESDEQVEFDKAIVRFQHLTDWVNRTGLETDILNPDPGAPFATAWAKSLPPLKALMVDDCELTLGQELSAGGDHRNDIVITQRWTLTVAAAERRPLEFFTNRVSDFHDLVSIAAGKVANIETFHFTHDDVPLRSLAGTPIGEAKAKLGYYSRWSNHDRHDERLDPHIMLFTFDDLGGIAGVERWMRFAGTYRSELSRVMATRYNKQMFLEDRVTNCVAALGSFDRTRRDDRHQGTYLVERLRECVNFAGPSFVGLLAGESVEDWTMRAKNHRNSLGHHLDAFRNDTGIIERELGDQLLWLATLCFLREAGALEHLFDKISRHKSYKWIAERAKTRRNRANT